MENNEQNNEPTPEPVAEDTTEVVEQAVEQVAEEAKDDRPEVNYRAELARKEERIRQLEMERASEMARKSTERRYDPNDITTWSDQELRLLSKSNDPTVHQRYKDQADDVLADRRLEAKLQQREEMRLKVESNTKLGELYPESRDPHSEFSMKMEKVMQDYGLHKTPAGRLAAAKIVEAEGKMTQAKGRKKESDRVAGVKGQMVDGDRPKSIEAKNPAKTKEELEKKALRGTEAQRVDALGDILSNKGISHEAFFKNR